MVGLPYDCLANPLGAVRLTFEKAVASGADPVAFRGKDWGALDVFRDFFSDQSTLAQVPVLNSKSMRYIQPNTLVRFRGMIQDMLGNEFYAGAYKDGSQWRTNKYTDISQFPMGSDDGILIWERHLLYCVPVPGLSSWADNSSNSPIPPSDYVNSLHRVEKRQREDDENCDRMDVQVSNVEPQTSPGSKKMREDGHFSLSEDTQDSRNGSSFLNASAFAKLNSDSLSYLVKIYDSSEAEPKLNDVFEFIGVVTFDSDQIENDEFTDVSVRFPTSKVPRLHCLIHRKLGIQDFVQSTPIVEPKLHPVREARESLLAYLTAVLGNDGLTAQFVLLHLLSKVHARVDTLAVGKLSLNLTCFTKESISIFGARISSAIKDLLPFNNRVPLTVNYLNTASLAPKKDYGTNRLVTGVLQLPESSHLTIDETQLDVGTLNSIGIENAKLLKDLIELQKVEYDFKYYKMQVTADVQLLVLSEGKSNILPADLVLPFRPSSVVDSGTVAVQALESWRWYLATLRSLPYSMGPEMQKVVENDWVTARQANRTLGSQDFSRWLTMGRLTSLSFGETCLSLEHWEMVKELERLRRERLT